MFRSGTTLLARMMNTHSEISMASDVMIEFFRTFRNEIYFQNNISLKNLSTPLESNFKEIQRERMNLIEKSNFDVTFKMTNPKNVIDDIKKQSKPFSPIFSNELFSKNESTLLEVFNNVIKTINASDKKTNNSIIGFKDVWSEQYSAPFLNQFPDSGRVIFIIRDPRSIVASNYGMNNHRYPLKFLIRQWRKSVCYSIMYSEIIQKYHKKCTYIKYEDLINEPKKTIQKMCSFLNIEFEENLMNPENYKDGKNEPWSQNSTFKKPKREFNKKSITQWKKVLEMDTQKFIEYSCFPEMKFLNYENLAIKESELKNLPRYPADNYSLLANWIKKFYSETTIKDSKWVDEIEKDEFLRNELFFGRSKKEQIKKYFIYQKYFDFITNR